MRLHALERTRRGPGRRRAERDGDAVWRLLAGLLRPSVGELELFGRSLASDPFTWRRNVTLLSHWSYLYEPLTALETVRLWARLLGRSTAEAELRARLAEVGLEPDADALVSGFSAGMQKRLSFARVRLEDARLILLDEPFAALDAAGQELVSEWIAADRRAGKTVVIASHNLERAARIADRAVLLKIRQDLERWRARTEEEAGK